MIHVEERTEPPNFDSQVRQPGQQWIKANPVRKKGEKAPAHWRQALPDLRKSYKGICAYFACYVKAATGGASNDHFVPKSRDRNRIYEWDNYRFACLRMNARKRDASDVLDPFQLADGWFEIYFPTMRVRPRRNLAPAQLLQVRRTIRRLKLNSAECRQEREEHWNDYKQHDLHVDRLIRYAPFIALEAVRQGLLRPTDGHVTAATIRAWLDS